MRIPRALCALVFVLPAAAAPWQQFGPSPQNNGDQKVSGRVSALAYSPNYDGAGTPALYVGAASGGVWRSSNFTGSTPTWTPLTDNLGLAPTVETGAICTGSIAVDPFHPNVVYVGTGEPNFSLDSRYGAGILKSTDGGATWALKATGLRRAAVSKVFVDPTDATGNTVYCSVVHAGNGVGGVFGVYKSVDAGNTWSITSGGIGASPVVTDLEYTVTPQNTLMLYAAVGYVWNSAQNGIWRSANGGKAWTRITAGLPSSSTIGRIALAADHTPGQAPALLAAITYSFNVSGKGGTLDNVYRSFDGLSFAPCTNPGNFAGGQGWYDLALALSSGNVIYAAGVSYPPGQNGVFQSADFGASWTAVDVGTNGLTPHTDHHAWAFGPNGKVYNGNDGGVYRFSPLSGLSLAIKGPVRFATIGSPVSVAAADVDRDGKQDIIAVARAANSVVVWRSTGSGTFATAVSYVVGTAPRGLVVADFNGDTKPDIAVTNETSNDVTILMNDGTGSFIVQPTTIPVGAGPVAIAAGDFNGDTFTDLAVSNNTAATLSILMGHGDGTFSVKDGPAVASAPYGIAAAKWAGGATDGLAVAMPGANSVAVYASNGDGTFAPGVSYAVGTAPYAVAAKDINSDSLPDIAAANSGSANVSVLTAAADGTFGAPVNYAAGTSPVALRLADVTGDNVADLVVANSTGATLSVLKGSLAGSFAAGVSYAPGGSPRDLAVADLDGDGHSDIVVGLDAAGAVNVLYDALVQGRAGRSVWESLNTAGLSTIQCQGVAQHPTDANIALEGSQDNGTARRSASTGEVWSAVYGGDGGLVRFDPITPGYVYKTAPQGSLGTWGFFQRSADAGITWTGETNGISQDETFPGDGDKGVEETGTLDSRLEARHRHAPDPSPLKFTGMRGGPRSGTTGSGIVDTAFPFYPVFAVDPANGQRLIIGSTTVYETKNRGDVWTAIGTNLANGNSISALSYAASADNTIYAAYGDGSVFRTVNDGALWADVSGGKPWSSRAIAGLVVDPRSADTAYVCIGAFGGGRIYRTVNGGASWSSVTGNLPDIPVYALALDVRGATPTLYAGTDMGVWQTADNGATWTRSGTGMPNVQVFDLDLNTRYNRLAAGTHGRGVFVMPVEPPYIAGDADGSGVVDTADVVRALSFVAGLRVPTASETLRSDLLKDNVITMGDAVSIARLALGTGG
ncbi:MAG TPA: FG-GAP-like repeat-containing protein [Armatimonadota bacterium]|jgi:hypothetical protein